jgi:RNA polymerase sigma-70 factor (ECF subfamily)
VLAAERATDVAAAMARLPEQQRVTLVLAAAGELNSAEIGAALGVPAGTVRYRLSLARRTLAEALADYDDPQEEP